MKNKALLVITFIFVVSCSSGGIVPTNYSGKGGKEKVVQRSGVRPNWLFERPMFVQNGNFYASGMFTDAPNLGKGLEIAAKLAQAKMVESLRLQLEESFKYASEGIDLPDTVVKHVVDAATGAITVKGMARNKYYYEKKQSSSAFGTVYRYDCFALVELSYDNYRKATVSAIEHELSGPVAEKIIQKIDDREREVYGIQEEDLNN